MKIVTSGCGYLDIDAYASCIAYANLLNLQGIPAKAVSTVKSNESITPDLLELNVHLDSYCVNTSDEFVLIDISNKDFFDQLVEEEKIVEIIDHHTGFEKYWDERLKDKSKIEFIGAVATLIVEMYEYHNLLNKMNIDIAYLLLAAILDNTLNLKAKMTTSRDIQAYRKLQQIVNDTGSYAEQYFLACQATIEGNLKQAILNDMKTQKINEVLPEAFGQLTLWNVTAILTNKELICNTLENIHHEWMINLISLKEGKSYILSKNPIVQQNLEKLLNSKFDDDVMVLDDVWLRKGIIKKVKNKKNVK